MCARPNNILVRCHHTMLFYGIIPLIIINDIRPINGIIPNIIELGYTVLRNKLLIGID